MSEPLVFRSRLAQVLAVLIAVVGVAALAAFVGETGVRGLVTTLAPVALVVVLGWALLWRPHARVSDDGITLVNVARTVHVPWASFRGADTRWALTVATDARTYTAWAVPAGSGFGARMAPLGRRGEQFSPADGKLRSSGTAEAAAVAIADRVRRIRADGETRGAVLGDGAAAEAEVTVTPNTEVLVAVGVLAALSALGILLG